MMKKAVFLIFVVFAFMSCNSVLIFRMEVLCPGSFVIPSHKNAILFVDRAVCKPEKSGHMLYLNSIYVRDTVFKTDSLSELILESVSKQVLNKGFFENSDSAHVDILVCLERMVIQSKTNSKPINFLLMATRDVSVNTVWYIFDVKADTLLSQFNYSDSLYWEKYSTKSLDAVKKELPRMEETFPEIAEVLAEKISPMVSPHWESVTRPYFATGSFRMAHAVDCVRQNDWEGAATLWKEEFNKGFGKSVFHAAMNMILYAEYLKDPNEALVWCEKAEKSMNERKSIATTYDWLYIERWKQILKVRSAEFEMLKGYLNCPKS